MVLGRDREFWHTPPAAALFLHRKLGGLYLLAARLKARVDVARLAQSFLRENETGRAPLRHARNKKGEPHGLAWPG